MVAKNNPDLHLYGLRGISSHDSGTYTISEATCCSGASITQNIDLYTQLIAGARHLDYRYGPKSDKVDDLIVMHGIHHGTNYFKELEGVLRFRREFPNEFFILDCNFEMRLSNDQKKYLIDWLANTFKDSLITQTDFDTWLKNYPKVPISEILNRPNKRILLLTDRYLFQVEESPGQIMPEGKINHMGLFNRDHKLEAAWHDRGTYAQIVQANDEYISRRPNPTNFLVAQYILTFQTTKTDIFNYIVGIESVRVDQKLYNFHGKRILHRALREASNKLQMSFAMIDFFQYDPYITHFLIGTNLKFNLKIWLACIYKNEECRDVTGMAKGLISNQNSLWIVDFKGDFNLESSSGTFMISFSWEGISNEVFVEEFKFESKTQYLLNQLRGGLKNEYMIHEFPIDGANLGSMDTNLSSVNPSGKRSARQDFVNQTKALFTVENKGPLNNS